MFFQCSPYISLCEQYDPKEGGGHFWNKLGRGLLGDAKYQGSRLYGFRQEDFFHVFPNIGL